jgi:3-hydroxyacyl-CoA dehydrogenase
MPLVQFERDGPVAIITIDNPPVNALSPGVPEGLLAAIDDLESDRTLRAAVLTCAGRTFIAGADIREFQKITSGQRSADLELNPILNRLEAGSKAVVAAIHGSALGGGLEVAMACHFRVATPGAQLGQPEVKLGLIPGAGGTQRLPRLVGVAKAAAMCSLGDPIGAEEARSHGLVSFVEEGELLPSALRYAHGLVERRVGPRRTRDLKHRLTNEAMATRMLRYAAAAAKQRFPGRAAPLLALDSIWAAVTKPFEEGLAEEARLFRQCLFSEESKALVQEFFDRRAKKPAPPEPAS